MALYFLKKSGSLFRTSDSQLSGAKKGSTVDTYDTKTHETV